MKKLLLIFGGLALGIFVSCDKLIQFSPFTTKLDADEKNLTSKNIELLSNYKSTSAARGDSVDIAFVSDVHFDYKELKKIVDHIRKNSHAKLAICGGDITDQGLLNEYRWFLDEMNRLPMPYLTVIGNHDYRADGEFIYDDMFGARNYTLSFHGWQLVFFDDVNWEKDGDPDFDWLEKVLAEGNPLGRVVITHIAPNCPQYQGEMAVRYRDILTKASPTLLLCGHNHSRSYELWEGIPMYIETRAGDKAYTTVRLYSSGSFSLIPRYV